MQHRHDAQGPPMVAVSRSRSSCPKGTIAALLNSTACDGGSWHMRVRACERCNPACCCGKKQISSSPHGTCSRPCSTEVTEDRKHRSVVCYSSYCCKTPQTSAFYTNLGLTTSASFPFTLSRAARLLMRLA
eukprot:scaffold83393_cov18-Tisochrysis_lutea.AAC.2